MEWLLFLKTITLAQFHSLFSLKTKDRVRKNRKKFKASSFWFLLKDLFRKNYYFLPFCVLFFRIYKTRSQELRKQQQNKILTAGFDNWSLIKGDDGRLQWGWEGSYSNTHQKKTRSHTAQTKHHFFLTLVTLQLTGWWSGWCHGDHNDTWWMLSLRLGSDDCPPAPYCHSTIQCPHSPLISWTPSSLRRLRHSWRYQHLDKHHAVQRCLLNFFR